MGMICVERTNQADLPGSWLGKVTWSCYNQQRAGMRWPKVQIVLVTNSCSAEPKVQPAAARESDLICAY